MFQRIKQQIETYAAAFARNVVDIFDALIDIFDDWTGF